MSDNNKEDNYRRPVKSPVPIYIAHEYGDESHFSALYLEAEKRGYIVSEQIILRKRVIVKKALKKVKQAGIQEGTTLLLHDLRRHLCFRRLRNEILIVGIAPYDTLLNKYKRTLKRNRSYYFTSFSGWNGEETAHKPSWNQQRFGKLLSECFIGAFCVNSAAASQVSQFISSTSVVYHSIVTALYKKKAGKSHKPKRYLFIGQTVPRKNVMLILDWMSLNQNASMTLTIVGTGELDAIIATQAASDKRIRQAGYLDKETIRSHLSQYDYLILPSKEEPFGIVLIEALAAGVPCIVSDAIGPREVIVDGDNGLVFRLHDGARGFDGAMRRSLFANDTEYAEMSNNAADSSLRFDSGEIIKRWMTLLEGSANGNVVK